MSIIRVKKDDSYFAALNAPFNDSRLSWGARGVLGYLLSKPDTWEVRNADLLRAGPSGDTKMRGILAELKEFGYLRRIKKREGDGTFTWESEVYENPADNPDFDGEPYVGNPRVDEPRVDEPHVDEPHVENPRVLVNTESVNTESVNTEKDGVPSSPTSPNSDSQYQRDIAHMGGVLGKVMLVDPNVAGRQFWGLAQDLVDADYDPDFILAAYDRVEGSWWYKQSYYGQRGKKPFASAIRKTVAEAYQFLTRTEGDMRSESSPRELWTKIKSDPDSYQDLGDDAAVQAVEEIGVEAIKEAGDSDIHRATFLRLYAQAVQPQRRSREEPDVDEQSDYSDEGELPY